MSTYHRGDLPSALLRAAAKIIEKQGIAGLSVREVARRARVSHNAPYRHFPDRDALLAGLAEEGFRLLGKKLGGKAGRAMGEAYVEFALEHPHRFRLMFGRQAGLAARQTYEALLDSFRTQREIADPEKAAAAAWSLVHGLAHLLLDGHFADQRTETFVSSVIGAVRFAAAQRPA